MLKRTGGETGAATAGGGRGRGSGPGTNHQEPVHTVPTHVQDAVFRELHQAIRTEAANERTREELAQELEAEISQIAWERNHNINADEQRHLARQFADEIRGVGPLQILLDDDNINDIMVNGPENVFIERDGSLIRTNVRFRDENHLRELAQRIARQAGREINETTPMVDARLPDGSRVNIVIPPIALNGTLISIRRFPSDPITLDGMMRRGTIDNNIRSFLEIAAKGRLNVLISGGTGSGKTTMLNACSQFIDPNERIVTIEDAAELQLQQPHVLSLETRPSQSENVPEIDQRTLLKNSLRMRPDRIIVGEVRGEESFDMLQAMNTGHEGSMGTLHANNPREALTRLEQMVMQAYDLPLVAIRHQIASAVDVIIQLERMSDGNRRVTDVVEITGTEGDTVTLQDLFRFEVEDNRSGRIHGRFSAKAGTPKCADKLHRMGLESAMRSIFMNA